MRALVQRVVYAQVKVDNELIGAIDKGLLVFIGVSKNDKAEEADWLADKIYNLRIFEDEQGKLNYSLAQTTKQILVISQFTLQANCSRGRRPDFTQAALGVQANKLYLRFIESLKQHGAQVQTGQFGAHMMVESVNDGPISLIVDKERSKTHPSK